MSKNSLLRETVDRLILQLTDGVFEILRDAIADKMISQASIAALTPEEIGKHVPLDVELPRIVRPRAPGRPAASPARKAWQSPSWDRALPADSQLSRQTSTPSTAVTDPELLLAAMATGDDAPPSERFYADEGVPRSRPRESRHVYLDTSKSQVPVVHAADPAVGKDEVIVRTPRGGVVLRRKREVP